MLGIGEDELQTKMGLAADAFAQAIRQVGNYDEIHARKLSPQGMSRAGSINARWTEDDLIYTPPARSGRATSTYLREAITDTRVLEKISY